VLEEEVVFDKDETGLTLSGEHIREALSRYGGGREYVLEAKIVCDTLNIRQEGSELLRVAVGGVYD
jgi:hypothetical protein